ncbi:MAG: hypothetical protein JEY94_18495 [Melioribacteraceae bacterium]|nr:hypothetical protein [Melioribacteraceae bacterium]
MGGIIYWTLIRTAILIPTLWFLLDQFDYKFWWIISIMSVYGVIIHPAILQYRSFMELSKEIATDTLCSTCKHFDESAIICMKHDKHPTKDFIPCDGEHWEPK